MRHLTDGLLRRLYDEPYALDEESRTHYKGCSECRERFTAIADDARHSQALMAVPATAVDASRAFALVRDRARPAPARVTAFAIRWRRPMVGGLAAAAVACGLVATLAFTSLGANLIAIFQPTQITPVSVTGGSKSDLAGLQELSQWGDVKTSSTPQVVQQETAPAAAKASSLPAIKVKASTLPSSLASAPVSYGSVGQASGSVTFNNNAPAKLRGSTLYVTGGPGEVAFYGDLAKLQQSGQQAGAAAGDANGQGSTPNGIQGTGHSNAQGGVEGALQNAGPILAVAEMKSPQVSSSGVSVNDIKTALLQQPNLSPTLKQIIQDINSPTGNLPIPIPAGYVNAHSVKVQGVNGTAVGDNTGLGSAVIWIKSGRVYAVAGTLTQDQVIAIANGLS